MKTIRKKAIFLLTLLVMVIPVLAQEIHEVFRSGDIDEIKTFLNQNPEMINGMDQNGRTPLFFAAGNGNIELCRLLIEKEAKVSIRNKYGRTPLNYAIWSNNKEIVELLIEEGADINNRDNEGYAILQQVLTEDQEDIAELLITKGADIKVKDDAGHTMLHYAAYYGRKNIVELLLDKGLDINKKDDGGDTPVHGASWGGYIEAVRLLIANGAELNVRNNKGKTPLDNAVKVGHKEVVELLTSISAVAGVPANKDLEYDPVLKTRVGEGEKNPVKMTVLYDNYIFAEGTKAEWGFSCLIEGTEKTILFDTGGESEVLMHNIDQLNVNLEKVEQIVISHNHWDHTGGLFYVLEKNHNAPVFLPYSFPYEFVRKVEKARAEVVPVNEPVEICKNVFLTGELKGPVNEQSVIVNTSKGLIVVTGCSHPGIVNIVKSAKEVMGREVYLVFGGFHLMRHSDDEVKDIISQFRELGVKKCGATHCTGDKQIKLFKEAYGNDYIEMGTGRVLEF